MSNKIAKALHTKALGAGRAVTEEQLQKINRLALVPLLPEQVYVRRYLMAHNLVDRDNERFAEALLEDFTTSLPGKGFFAEGHPSAYGKGGPGEGRFFDSTVEDMSSEAFTALTGASGALPEGVNQVRVLWGDAYILKLDSNADTLAKIDAGIYAYTSIGFKAALSDVTDERGNYIYGEYRPKGEALEGSLVWLGAQPGTSAVKSAKNIRQEDNGMLEKLNKTFGKTFTEGDAVDGIKAMLDEKEAEIKALRPIAEDGRAYRKALVEDVIRFGVLIDEIPTDEAGQKTEEEFLSPLPIPRLKTIRDKYELKAHERFPDKFQFRTQDENDRQQKAKEAEGLKKSTETTNKKDYTDPKFNELLAVN